MFTQIIPALATVSIHAALHCMLRRFKKRVQNNVETIIQRKVQRLALKSAFVCLSVHAKGRIDKRKKLDDEAKMWKYRLQIRIIETFS